MTRIVAGSAKGQKLAVPKSGTRPTAERVREALFSRLEHYDYIEDCRVLDLFAGSGALALEALSRGAADAVCVEASSAAAQIIRANAKSLQLKVSVVNQKVQTYLVSRSEFTSAQSELSVAQDNKFDLVFIDPPYNFTETALAQILQLLLPVLKDDAMVIVERASRAPEPSWPEFFTLDDTRQWGDTRVWTAVRAAASSSVQNSSAQN